MLSVYQQGCTAVYGGLKSSSIESSAAAWWFGLGSQAVLQYDGIKAALHYSVVTMLVSASSGLCSGIWWAQFSSKVSLQYDGEGAFCPEPGDLVDQWGNTITGHLTRSQFVPPVWPLVLTGQSLMWSVSSQRTRASSAGVRCQSVTGWGIHSLNVVSNWKMRWSPHKVISHCT